MQVCDRGLYGGHAVTFEHFGQVFVGRAGGGHLRQNVTLTFLGTANVGHDQIQLLTVRASSGKQPQGWDSQPFLPGIPSFGNVTAGPCTANIGPVGKADSECLQSPVGKNRPQCLDVRQMITAKLRKVEEPDIAG